MKHVSSVFEPAVTRPLRTSTPRRHESRTEKVTPVVILLSCVAAVKLLVVWQLSDHPMVQPDTGLDTTAYAELARRVVAGDWGLGPGLYYVSPLYIYVLAVGLAVTDSFTAMRVLQVLVGTLAVGGIWTMTRAWSNTRAAWLAALLAAGTGLITFYEVLILQASIDTALTTAVLLALTRALHAHTRGTRAATWWIVTGVALGLAALNRPNFVPASGVLLLVAVAATWSEGLCWVLDRGLNSRALRYFFDQNAGSAALVSALTLTGLASTGFLWKLSRSSMMADADA